MNYNIILILVSSLIIVSYLISVISNKINIPSVLMLILAGLVVKYIVDRMGLALTIELTTLQLIGTLGLILIVLDGALDLNIHKDKVEMVIKCLLFSIMMIGVLSVIIGIVINRYYKVTFFASLINAIPLSIVSSAIIIPSVSKLNKPSREFLIYNSIFSDIFGVLVFNFLVFFKITRYIHIIGFLASLVLTISLSILFSILMTLVLIKFRQGNEIVFIIATIILLYSIGKLFHLSSLILVFIFGLMLSNFYTINKKFDLVSGKISIMTKVIKEFRMSTTQFSFIVRSLFFFIFGFSIKLNSLWKENNIILIGVFCLLIIYFLRYILLKNIFHNTSLGRLLIAPRGLITILLFYTIPSRYSIESFREGNILFFVILTNIIMIIGLLFGRREADLV